MADFWESVKPGTGFLHKNTYKENETHPDYTGRIKGLTGKMLDLAAWVKSGENGKFLSIKMSLPFKEKTTPGPAEAETPDEEIPF